jgi:hypothetical protein
MVALIASQTIIHIIHAIHGIKKLPKVELKKNREAWSAQREAKVKNATFGSYDSLYIFFLYHELHEYHEPESLYGYSEFMSSTMNGGNHEWWMLRIYISPADNKAARLHHSWLPSSLRRPSFILFMQFMV